GKEQKKQDQDEDGGISAALMKGMLNLKGLQAVLDGANDDDDDDDDDPDWN
ncbi:MAG: hypothetical protein EZS28_026517, partial [Streblomastix strix]